MMKKRSLGSLMCDLRSLQLAADEQEMLMHPHVGGVILFSRNYESPQQLSELTQSIHALRQPRLLIAVDHEGGRVQRFRDGFSPLPAAALLGDYQPTDQALVLARHTGWLMAAELLAVGVDLSFAPVLDVGGKVSEVIADRALHSDPEQISVLARAFMNGMKQAGMAAVGKHFPGHGSVAEDSHIAIPRDQRSFKAIRRYDLVPFARLIHAGLPGMMPAHVIYPDVDEKPAGFSAIWLKQILREQLGFQGAIFSDDLSMAGAEVMGDYPERAEAAIEAGCDMVLACNNQPGAIAILDRANIPENMESRTRLIRMHGDVGMDWETLKQTRTWRDRAATVAKLEEQLKLEP